MDMSSSLGIAEGAGIVVHLLFQKQSADLTSPSVGPSVVANQVLRASSHAESEISSTSGMATSTLANA